MVKTWDECMVMTLMGTLLISNYTIPNRLTAMPQDLCAIQVLTMAHMDHGWPADFQSKGYKQPELPEPPNKITPRPPAA